VVLPVVISCHGECRISVLFGGLCLRTWRFRRNRPTSEVIG